jgi:TonB family protein
MLVGTEKRKKRNSTKVNLVISGVFHGVIVAGVLYFAARSGYLGKQIQTIAVDMVKEKPQEKPKELPKPKLEEAKVEQPKTPDPTKPQPPPETHPAPPPPSTTESAAVAPPPADLPAFDFGGGREVKTADAVQVYKELLQNALQLNWERPGGDGDDHTNVAEVEISVDKTGNITPVGFKKKSGQKAWDDSVQQAIKSTPKAIRPPPSNFPARVVVQFDVQEKDAFAQQP